MEKNEEYVGIVERIGSGGEGIIKNGEYTINRHRDFSCFLDSGAAFIVTPLL